MDVKKERIETCRVAYYRHTGEYAGDSALFAKLFNHLTTWATSAKLDNVENADSIVIYHDAIEVTEADRLRISVGMVVTDDTAVGGQIGELMITGEYLICRYHLDNDEYGQAWQQVYRQIIPERGLQPSQGYAFERYAPNCYNKLTNKTSVEICVPV